MISIKEVLLAPTNGVKLWDKKLDDPTVIEKKEDTRFYMENP